jgi:hypothetical protein
VLLALAQRRQYQRRQDPDDSNDYQQLDQGEAGPPETRTGCSGSVTHNRQEK